jgi:golgin subfamily B member 1
MEVKLVRGPRRLEAQRRLAFIKQDVLGDPAGALEMLGPVCSADPADDDVRGRFVALSLSLNQPSEAARLLGRALTTCKDPAIRARVGAEISTVFLRAGDVKRAEASFQQVIADQADDSADPRRRHPPRSRGHPSRGRAALPRRRPSTAVVHQPGFLWLRALD